MQFPYGSRFLFKSQSEIDAWLVGVDSPLKEDFQRTFDLFNDKKPILRRALWEIDGLLDSDCQWEDLSSILLYQARSHSEDGASFVRKRRKKAVSLKNDIYNGLQDARRKMRELERLGFDDEEDYFPDSARNPLASLRLAALLQNEFSKLDETKSTETCTYQSNLEDKLNALVDKEPINAVPNASFILLALGLHFRMEEKDDQSFDPLTFSQRGGPGDFIRGLTNEIKVGIEGYRFSSKLRKLSSLSIETFAGLLYPEKDDIKVSNFVDIDWNPVKK